MPEIKKVLNNNVAVILSPKGLETVVMGNGIAFQKKPGDVIPEEKIEKIFTLLGKDTNNKFQELVTEIPMEHMTRKLIALDIDGTLYNDQAQITTRTKEALIRVQEKGHILVLASGRPTSGLAGIAAQLDMPRYHGLLLAYNGGVVTDCETDQTLYSRTIAVEIVKNLLHHLDAFPVTPIIDDGYFIYTDNPDGYMLDHESSSNGLPVKKVGNLQKEIDFSPAKVVISAPAEILSEHAQEISKPFADVLSFAFSAPFYFEVTSIGVDKADSLKKVCDKLRIDRSDVIAFGDAQNDVNMIKFAGTGVAMGNACKELKEIANMETQTNNKDGIAIALEKLEIL